MRPSSSCCYRRRGRSPWRWTSSNGWGCVSSEEKALKRRGRSRRRENGRRPNTLTQTLQGFLKLFISMLKKKGFRIKIGF